jgi:hypothetical protein
MKSVSFRTLALLGLSAEVFVVLFAWYTSGDTTDFFQTATRVSGRVSLLFFTILLLFCAFPDGVRGKWTADPSGQERALFGAFALVHVIHFYFLATFVLRSGVELIPQRLAGGALAYFLTVAYPLMAHYRAGSERLRGILRNAHLYFVWFVMFMTYFSRVKAEQDWVGGRMMDYRMLFGYTIVLLAAHLVIRFANKRL